MTGCHIPLPQHGSSHLPAHCHASWWRQPGNKSSNCANIFSHLPNIFISQIVRAAGQLPVEASAGAAAGHLRVLEQADGGLEDHRPRQRDQGRLGEEVRTVLHRRGRHRLGL